MSGQGIANWRFQPDVKKLNAHNAGSLPPAWVATPAGDISATPAVVDGAVYVPDWGGNVSKLDAKTGAVIWSKSVGALSVGDRGWSTIAGPGSSLGAYATLPFSARSPQKMPLFCPAATMSPCLVWISMQTTGSETRTTSCSPSRADGSEGRSHLYRRPQRRR